MSERVRSIKPLVPMMEPRSERRRTIRMIGRRVVGDETRLVAYRETWLRGETPNIFACTHVTLNATTRRRVLAICPNCTPPPPLVAAEAVRFTFKG